MNKLFTIGIPAYNRPEELKLLLDSIKIQFNSDVEVLVIEDNSPSRSLIREVVNSSGIPIKYIENDINLGYDGNIRNIILNASGEYIIFMGNDDLLVDGAVEYYKSIVTEYGPKDLGFIVRAYQEYDNETGRANRIIRYVENDIFLNPNQVNAAFTFRRSVAIMGMCYRTKLVKELNTDKYDGSIYYQLWLSGNLALKHSVYVASKVTALRRCGIAPDFGNATVEKKAVVNHYYSSQAFTNYVDNMLKIAADVASVNKAEEFYRLVINDFRNYSYPFLAPVRSNGLIDFIIHYNRMRKTGIGSGILFNIYFLMLLCLGKSITEKILAKIAERLSTTSIFWRAKLNDPKN